MPLVLQSQEMAPQVPPSAGTATRPVQASHKMKQKGPGRKCYCCTMLKGTQSATLVQQSSSCVPGGSNGPQLLVMADADCGAPFCKLSGHAVFEAACAMLVANQDQLGRESLSPSSNTKVSRRKPA